MAFYRIYRSVGDRPNLSLRDKIIFHVDAFLPSITVKGMYCFLKISSRKLFHFNFIQTRSFLQLLLNITVFTS